VLDGHEKDCTVGKLSECNEACDEVKDPQMELELHLQSRNCTATTGVACAGSEMGSPMTTAAASVFYCKWSSAEHCKCSFHVCHCIYSIYIGFI
jgi:hypothetical protein